jgi:hypothetical protein
MRRTSALIAAASVLLGACAGPSVLLAGESMRPPEPPPPTLSFVVYGADDLTPITAELAYSDSVITTDEAGTVTMIWDERPIDLEVSAAGFHAANLTVTEKPL